MDPNKIGTNPEQQPNTGTETDLTDTHKDEPKKRNRWTRMVAGVMGIIAGGGLLAGAAHNSDKANAKTGPYPTHEHNEPHPAGPQSDNPESIIGTVDTSNNPGGGQGIEDASENGKPNTGFVPSRAEDVPPIPNFNGNPSIEVPPDVMPGVEIQSGSEGPAKPNASSEDGAADPAEGSANSPVDSYTIPVNPSLGDTRPNTEPGPGAAAGPGNPTSDR